MSKIRQKIYLAALLHDIGKFYQRADNKLLRDYTSDSEERLKDLVCPGKNEKGEKKYSHHHAFYTAKFLLEHKDDVFHEIAENGTNIFRGNVYVDSDQDNLLNLSAFHHKPDSHLQRIVQFADWCSSGMERNQDNEEKDDGINQEYNGLDHLNFGRFKYKKVPLLNIFNRIKSPKVVFIDEKNVEDKEKAEEPKKLNSKISAFPMQELNLLDKCLPNEFKQDDIPSKEEAETNYMKLWTSFIEDIKRLPTDSFNGFSESLLYLLRQYTWCIPASTNDMAHISLFEHLKTTGGFATCLYDYFKDKQGKDEVDFNYQMVINEQPFLLTCWDVSGIQKFIYDIANRKAAVSLKGRSFYLHLLGETIIQKCVLRLNMHYGQVIYSSGGKIYMLLPNTEKTKKELKQLHKDFEKSLWAEHKNGLYLCMGYEPFGILPANTQRRYGKENENITKVLLDVDGQLERKDMGDLWKAASEKAASNKSNKYRHVIKEQFNDLFKPQAVSPDSSICAVTAEFPSERDPLVKLDPKQTGENSPRVLRSVKAQSDMGKTLKDADYLITYIGEAVEGNKYLNKKNKGKAFNLRVGGEIGVNHYLFDELDLIYEDSGFRDISSVDVSRVKRINQTDFKAVSNLKGRGCSYGYNFYGGNKQAEIFDSENGGSRFKTFEELCVSEEEEVSTYLGVLRMDVDNLGKVFIDGLSDREKSFAAYATLSSQLDWFFSGYLNTIRGGHKYKDWVNILYSGGDDVFAVGRWDKLLEFASEIRKKFHQFTGERNDISLSAGLVIVRQKFPISKAADNAGEAEALAKKYRKPESNMEDKNAFTFFGTTISWDDEYEEVEYLKEQFIKHCGERGQLGKAILHQLINWSSMVSLNEKPLNGEKKANFQYKWHTAYYLKRYQNRVKKKNPATYAFLVDITNSLMSGQFVTNSKIKSGERYYHLAALAARWAEYLLKENLSNKK